MTEPRKLHLFLRYASQDEPILRELHERLDDEGWIESRYGKEGSSYGFK